MRDQRPSGRILRQRTMGGSPRHALSITGPGVVGDVVGYNALANKGKQIRLNWYRWSGANFSGLGK